MTEITSNRAGPNLTPHPAERDRNTADFDAAGDRKPAFFSVLVQAEFSDIDRLCEAVRDWNLDFRPINRPTAGPRLARLVQASSGLVHYGYARCMLNIEQFGAPPPGCVTFGVLEPSVRHLWWRGRDIDNTTVLVFPFGGELHSISGADFGVHTVSIDVALIEEICGRLGMGAMPGFAQPEVFRADPRTLRFLRSRLAKLVVAAAKAPRVDARPVAEALVRSWGEACGAVPVAERGAGQGRTMRKALERLDAPDWLALTPADLCHHAGVAERTLQIAFRSRFGITPAAFLKARRLAAVRAALKGAHEYESVVGDIAADYGFWHTGQFAADYRRVYGELPSETLRRGYPRR